jgi:FAD/FMN-containing dehydrogenase
LVPDPKYLRKPSVHSPVKQTTLEQLKAVVGPAGYRETAADLEPHLTEWRGLFRGHTPLLLLPTSTGQVSEILRICNAASLGVVPQGGNTGLAGGAIPGIAGDGEQILLGSGRLNRVRELDAENYTITVEAGCLLANVQTAACDAGLYFPLSLAAEGSCHIGGNISTNAGGTNVLRYGNTRELVLGLEIVLPDGRVYDGLRGLRKDNTGYDLKQLFIGAEGTLGFITAATLKLFPAPRSSATAWLAVRDPSAAVRLYSAARQQLGDEMVAFELLPRIALDMVLAHIPGSREPLAGASAWYVLLELAGARDQSTLDDALAAFLASRMEDGLVQDGVVASSAAQRTALWSLRHAISEAQKKAGASIKHDISVPVSRIPQFLASADELVKARVPGIRPVPFGHLGDGNLHYNLSQPVAMEAQAFLDLWAQLNHIVHSLAVSMGGSFSAEHGIGFLKTAELERLASPVALELMRAVKSALDPRHIMNPGKVLR